jgi:hypothetical protein
MRHMARIAANVALAVVVVGACMQLAGQFGTKTLPRGFRSPILAMELGN